MPKITIITTVDHNVGDDFVREGILYLLEKRLGHFSAQLIHKHIPLTVRPEWDWFYSSGLSGLLDRLPRARGLFWSKVVDHLPLVSKTDKILNCDLLVQSGAPVYWQGAHCTEWFAPLITKRYLTMKQRTPFINIGAGTCQPYESDGSEVVADKNTAEYIRNLHNLCSVTTLRDKLSKRILNSLGLDAPVITCPSIFARERLQIPSQAGDYVALNFMPLGGHYDYHGDSPVQWEQTFTDFFKLISKRAKTVLACHNQKEFKVAKKIAPDANIFIGETASDYLNFYSRAQYFIGCRVHAAFATASFGKPAFVLGNDTRAKMTEELGLKSVCVKDVTVDLLMSKADELEKMCNDYPEQFSIIKKSAYNSYIQSLEPVFNALR